jgi:integrase
MAVTKKYRLTQAQLRGLTLDQRPALDSTGKTVLVPNPGRRPYRFADGSQGAPGGFTIYVGGRGARYEIRSRVGGKAVRIALGSVADLSLPRAHELAAETRGHIRVVGVDPRATIKAEAVAREARGRTVGAALRAYIAHLEGRRAMGKAKENGVDGARKALARLERPEVGLAGEAIADLSDERLRAAWAALRQSAMIRSNRLPAEVREKLTAFGPWWTLTRADLVARLGLSGKHVALAYAAGMAAAEHTMGDAARAVARVIEAERKAASNAGRPAALAHNPFDVLRDDGLYRSTRELRQHYDAARVRNPLGVDDSTTGSKSLPTVLKAIVARRDHQGGHNAAAVDYLLLMLLWGTRRSEVARLRWYDSCSPDEVDPTLRLASWVWIAPTPRAKNPATGKSGSQVFFHDSKSGDSMLRPVAYFAGQVLRWRLAARAGAIERLTKEVERSGAAVQRARIGSAARVEALAARERAEWRLEQVRRWVFPARNPKAQAGHYTDSKSILANVRDDAGLDAADVGLTPHDFRRTMGRMAAKLLPGHLVSQLLHHHRDDDPQAMAPVSERYSEAEWADLREAMEKVDEAIIATSPRVWNILKGSDRPRLDERDDPEVVVPTWRGRGGGSKTDERRSAQDDHAAPRGGRRTRPRND